MAKLRYNLFGQEFIESQGEMMARVFETLLSRHPALLPSALKEFRFLYAVDDSGGNQAFSAEPSGFFNKSFQIAGQRIYIRTAFNWKQKQSYVERLFCLCEEDRNALRIFKEETLGTAAKSQIEPKYDDKRQNLRYYQKEAVKAVMETLHDKGRESSRLGIVCMPEGTGKRVVLSALFSKLFQDRETDLSVLLLVGRTDLALQYAEALLELTGSSYPVEIAKTGEELIHKVKEAGTVLISTAQKLLIDKSRPGKNKGQDIAPYSESSRILVVVEEIAYPYFSRTYYDMHARFPNALFLGLTGYPALSRRSSKMFGPILYGYSFEQAYKDGIIRMINYYRVNPADGTPALPEMSGWKTDLNPLHTAKWYKAVSKAVLEWMIRIGDDPFALLLCDSQSDAKEFYDFLTDYLDQKKWAVYLDLYPRNKLSRTSWKLFEHRQWEGRRFAGIVIANTPVTGGPSFDLVFLARAVTEHFLITALSSLTKPIPEKSGNGILVDFKNSSDSIIRMLPDHFPLQISNEYAESQDFSSEYPDSPEMDLEELSDELSRYQFSDARRTLFRLQGRFPLMGEQLSEELEFLFDPSIEMEKQRRYWRQHRSELEWKTDLWCLLSKHSKKLLKISDETTDQAGMDGPETLTDGEEERAKEEVTFFSSGETSQERGSRLEQAALELFRRLFELDEAGSQEVLEKLRRQRAGTQYGFDVAFTYRDRFGTEVNCKVECKNYRDNVIRLDDVSPKLVSLQQTGEAVDHWILISPNGQVSNELSQMAEQWRENFRWEPIRDVQFWTLDEPIRELFALFPDLYTEFYGEWVDSPYREWDSEKRKRVLRYWKEKLAPVPYLPRKWREYLQKPAKLLTQCEGDRDTGERYEVLYENYVPMHLLDEEGSPLDGTAEEYICQWLEKTGAGCALLLGDFGDGKTYFTYTLARKLSREFLASPDTGWIALRLSLNDLRDNRMDCREFLHRRLREFGGTLDEWNEIQRNYPFCIILDGLDEMSLGMNDTAVLENLGRLEELMEQFKGHKLLITSRKMAVYADKIRERILGCLENPEILQLAPITQRDCLAFLQKLADTPQRREHLLKIQNTHDLLGLAAKPLFLEMIQVLLDSDEIQKLDAAGIYRQYTEKVLARKFPMQLRRNCDYTRPEAVRSNMLFLLEKLALCLQTEGLDSISLEKFKQKIGQNNLAELLWNTIESTEAAEDADARIINRSLLKYDSANSMKACFCHRSMKEYFVACGLIRRLREEPEEGRALLMNCNFGYEILEFAGDAIGRLSRSEQRVLIQSLHDFAHETGGKGEGALREPFERLGTNSVNLIFYAGYQLQGTDWSGLLLNNVVLSGRDLSGKDFSGSSMRYAHLENADFTGCNLCGCDFTGVQFEKSGQLSSFAVDPRGGELLVAYKNGKIRRWPLAGGNSDLLAEMSLKEKNRIFLLEGGCEGILRSGSLRFWHRTPHALKMRGAVNLCDDTKILDIGKSSALIWKNETLCLLNLHTGKVLLEREVPETIQACLLTDEVFFVHRKGRGVELIDSLGQETSQASENALRTSQASQDISRTSRGEMSCPLPEERSITALNAFHLTETEGILTVGYKNGSVRSYRVKRSSGERQWEFREEAVSCGDGERILNVDADGIGGFYASIPCGTVIRYRKNEQGELTAVKTYQLEFKCSGAQIEGVRPREQYEILLRARDEK